MKTTIKFVKFDELTKTLRRKILEKLKSESLTLDNILFIESISKVSKDSNSEIHNSQICNVGCYKNRLNDVYIFSFKIGDSFSEYKLLATNDLKLYQERLIDFSKLPLEIQDYYDFKLNEDIDFNSINKINPIKYVLNTDKGFTYTWEYILGKWEFIKTTTEHNNKIENNSGLKIETPLATPIAGTLVTGTLIANNNTEIGTPIIDKSLLDNSINSKTEEILTSRQKAIIELIKTGNKFLIDNLIEKSEIETLVSKGLITVEYKIADAKKDEFKKKTKKDTELPWPFEEWKDIEQKDLPETIAYYYKTYCDRTSIGLIRFHPVDQKIIVYCNNGTNQTWQNTEIGWKRR